MHFFAHHYFLLTCHMFMTMKLWYLQTTGDTSTWQVEGSSFPRWDYSSACASSSFLKQDCVFFFFFFNNQPCPLLMKISVVLPFPPWLFYFYCTPPQLDIFSIIWSLSFLGCPFSPLCHIHWPLLMLMCTCARQRSVNQVKSSQGLFKVSLIYTSFSIF